MVRSRVLWGCRHLACRRLSRHDGGAQVHLLPSGGKGHLHLEVKRGVPALLDVQTFARRDSLGRLVAKRGRAQQLDLVHGESNQLLERGVERDFAGNGEAAAAKVEPPNVEGPACSSSSSSHGMGAQGARHMQGQLLHTRLRAHARTCP